MANYTLTGPEYSHTEGEEPNFGLFETMHSKLILQKSKSSQHANITNEQKASQDKWSPANCLMVVLMNFYLDLM